MFKTKLAREIWESKYKFGDETPIETFERVAKALSSIEKDKDYWYDQFLNIMVRFDENLDAIGLKCTTGGRITANAGTTFKKATLLNCFVHSPVTKAKVQYQKKTENNLVSFPVEYETDENPDDLLNIFLTIVEQAKTLASEGGYGLNFDFIRPRGSLIKGTGIKHPGVVAYMKIWDAVSQCIVQGDADGYVDRIKNYLGDEKFEEVKQIVKDSIRKGAMIATLSCFSKNTTVLTDKGWLDIVDVIERIKNNEELKAIDEFGNENLIYDPVQRQPEQIYELETCDGSKIEVTADHEFEVRNIETNEVYLKALKDIDSEKEEIKVVECN
jgi:ribonucleotide reductase alpha subunit